MRPKTKKCSCCNKIFPATPKYFYRHKDKWDKLNCYCKLCIREKYATAEKRNTQNQMRYRKKLVAVLKVNGCAICGYNKCNRALEFHHVEPKLRSFYLNDCNLCKKDEFVIEEIAKCILLCSNCHREMESL